MLFRFLLNVYYPPVGSGATEGVLSEGYMLVRIRSCINNRNVQTVPTKNVAEKKWRQLSRVLHSFWWSHFPTGGVPWGPCVYIAFEYLLYVSWQAQMDGPILPAVYFVLRWVVFVHFLNRVVVKEDAIKRLTKSRIPWYAGYSSPLIYAGIRLCDNECHCFALKWWSRYRSFRDGTILMWHTNRCNCWSRPTILMWHTNRCPLLVETHNLDADHVLGKVHRGGDMYTGIFQKKKKKPKVPNRNVRKNGFFKLLNIHCYSNFIIYYYVYNVFVHTREH